MPPPSSHRCHHSQVPSPSGWSVSSPMIRPNPPPISPNSSMAPLPSVRPSSVRRWKKSRLSTWKWKPHSFFLWRASGAVVVNRFCRSEDGRAGGPNGPNGPRGGRRASCSHRGNCRALMNLKPPLERLPPPRCRRCLRRRHLLRMVSSFYSSLFSHHSSTRYSLEIWHRDERRRRTNRPSVSVRLSFRSLPSFRRRRSDSHRLSSSARCLARQSVSQTVRETRSLAPPAILHSFPSEHNAATISWRGGEGGGSST